jgi:hypothetical protein
MFKKTVPPKTHTPLFASDAYPESKPKTSCKCSSTLPRSLNSYEVIRDKVVHDMKPKAIKTEPHKPVKKKLLTG